MRVPPIVHDPEHTPAGNLDACVRHAAGGGGGLAGRAFWFLSDLFKAQCFWSL